MEGEGANMICKETRMEGGRGPLWSWRMQCGCTGECSEVGDARNDGRRRRHSSGKCVACLGIPRHLQSMLHELRSTLIEPRVRYVSIGRGSPK